MFDVLECLQGFGFHSIVGLGNGQQIDIIDGGGLPFHNLFPNVNGFLLIVRIHIANA